MSGEGGELMTDSDNSTCAPVNQPTPDGAVLQYTYSILNKCMDNGNFRLKVTMDSVVPCSYLRTVFFTEKVKGTCDNKESDRLHPCTVLESGVEDDRSICTLWCKCASSSDQCFLQVYSGMKPDIPQFGVCDV